MAKLSTDELLESFKEMTLIELSEFVKQFEDTFGVTAAAPVAVPARPQPAVAPPVARRKRPPRTSSTSSSRQPARRRSRSSRRCARSPASVSRRPRTWSTVPPSRSWRRSPRRLPTRRRQPSRVPAPRSPSSSIHPGDPPVPLQYLTTRRGGRAALPSRPPRPLRPGVDVMLCQVSLVGAHAGAFALPIGRPRTASKPLATFAQTDSERGQPVTSRGHFTRDAVFRWTMQAFSPSGLPSDRPGAISPWCGRALPGSRPCRRRMDEETEPVTRQPRARYPSVSRLPSGEVYSAWAWKSRSKD